MSSISFDYINSFESSVPLPFPKKPLSAIHSWMCVGVCIYERMCKSGLPCVKEMTLTGFDVVGMMQASFSACFLFRCSPCMLGWGLKADRPA